MPNPELPVLVSGLAWTVAYVLIAKRGFEDRTYGMPLPALAANLAWEVTFTFVYPPAANPAARYANIAWLLIDMLIVATFFRYGFRSFQTTYGLRRAAFNGLAFAALALAFGLMLGLVPLLQDAPYFKGDAFEVAKLVAYGQNLLMSLLFLLMLWSRRSAAGQSLHIAFWKWLGTFAVGARYVLHHHELLPWVLIGALQICDILYIVLIYRQLRKEGRNPWTHL